MIKKWEELRDESAGVEAHRLAERLWPICRSLTGEGVRESLRIIKEHLPGLQIHEVPSGTKCLDWEVPQEWNIRDAYLIDPSGRKIADFRRNNLHVVGYSHPVNQEMTLEELRPHLFSLPDQPNAIPYVTSYYKRFFGFCLTHEELSSLKPGKYRVFIDSTLGTGSLTYADLVLPGESDKEIFLSTYVCHPSLANNELSGPVVTVALAKWLMSLKNRKYTYRIYFGPETIGALVYMSKHLPHMKEKTHSGYVITCVGDDRAYSFLPSRYGNTVADRLTEYVLQKTVGNYEKYSYLLRGSDERQYCGPLANLPVVSVMRTKYGMYPEYHTSLDDLNLITPRGLGGAIHAYKACLTAHEMNRKYCLVQAGEPQLGKRGLYPNLSTKTSGIAVMEMMNLLSYCDGGNDLLEACRYAEVDFLEGAAILKPLLAAGVIREL